MHLEAYHLHVSDKVAEHGEKDLFPDWSMLDAEALSAAIAKYCIKNVRDKCQLWYHHSSLCSSHLCVSGGDNIK